MGIQKRNRARGREAEKRVASNLGGMAIGILSGEDVLHNYFSIEVKSRKKCVTEGWFSQAMKNNIRGVTPIVVLHITSKSSDNDTVMIRMKDFKKLLSRVED